MNRQPAVAASIHQALSQLLPLLSSVLAALTSVGRKRPSGFENAFLLLGKELDLGKDCKE